MRKKSVLTTDERLLVSKWNNAGLLPLKSNCSTCKSSNGMYTPSNNPLHHYRVQLKQLRGTRSSFKYFRNCCICCWRDCRSVPQEHKRKQTHAYIPANIYMHIHKRLCLFVTSAIILLQFCFRLILPFTHFRTKMFALMLTKRFVLFILLAWLHIFVVFMFIRSISCSCSGNCCRKETWKLLPIGIEKFRFFKQLILLVNCIQVDSPVI